MKPIVKSSMKSLVAVYSSVECALMAIDFIGHLLNITSTKIKPVFLKAICCWHR